MPTAKEETKRLEEESIFQKRLEALKKMPPGPEKDEAIRQLSQDYKGKREIIDQEIVPDVRILTYSFADERLGSQMEL